MANNNDNTPLTSEQIVEFFLSDIYSYKENIIELISRRFEDVPDSKTYWDAWFRGAENKQLEDAERGIVFGADKN